MKITDVNRALKIHEKYGTISLYPAESKINFNENVK